MLEHFSARYGYEAGEVKSKPPFLGAAQWKPRIRAQCRAEGGLRLITERQGRSLILTANRTAVDWYPAAPQPVLAEVRRPARIIYTAHHMDGRSYRTTDPAAPATKRNRPGTSYGLT